MCHSPSAQHWQHSVGAYYKVRLAALSAVEETRADVPLGALSLALHARLLLRTLYIREHSLIVLRTPGAVGRY